MQYDESVLKTGWWNNIKKLKKIISLLWTHSCSVRCIQCIQNLTYMLLYFVTYNTEAALGAPVITNKFCNWHAEFGEKANLISFEILF